MRTLTLKDKERLSHERRSRQYSATGLQGAARYGVCSRTIARWERNPRLGFPAALVVNHRKYRRLAELQAWDRVRAAGKSVEVA
jgi:hypothetical protein